MIEWSPPSTFAGFGVQLTVLTMVSPMPIVEVDIVVMRVAGSTESRKRDSWATWKLMSVPTLVVETVMSMLLP